MNTDAQSAKSIVRTANQAGDHGRVVAFQARWRAIFAIGRDVKNWPQLLLQRQGLADQFFAPGKMLADRQSWKGLAGTGIENRGGMKQVWWNGRRLHSSGLHRGQGRSYDRHP